jgi:tetratricopeptide (TPR) repeat protein
VNKGTSTASAPFGRQDLAAASAALDAALTADDPQGAAQLAQPILKAWPRHLATYQRLLTAAWRLQRWDEGEDWGRRLLRADPGSASAWQALAMAAEQRSQRAQAHAAWQRAFEAEPYAAEIRAGLSRTMLRTADRADDAAVLMLNLACLARLYLKGYRWARAAALYRQLIHAAPQRIDFQAALLAALWQQRARQEALELSRELSQQQPHLFLAWVVLEDVGDVNDKALARNPLTSMDPAGEYTSRWLGLPYSR